MITGFTGSSRRITNAQKAAIVALLVDASEVHHGDCIVADEWAHRVAVDLRKAVVIHPPDQEKARAFCARMYPGDNVTELPTKPYLDRDSDIVEASQILIAVPNKPEADGQAGGGTWATVRYARAAGIPIIVVHPDGRIEQQDPEPEPASEPEQPKARKSRAKPAPEPEGVVEPPPTEEGR